MCTEPLLRWCAWAAGSTASPAKSITDTLNAIRWLFILNGVNTAAGLVLIITTSLASPSGQTLYTVTVLVWGIDLAVALLLLAVAFRRRLLLGFHDRTAPQPAAQ